MRDTCPNCQHFNIESFYYLDGAPVVSSLLCNTKNEALKVKRKPIELVICLNCGFIYNKLYDFSVHSNPEGHDDQQGYSLTFNKFITRISKRVIEKYQIRNKIIIEIGCGKGDFLKLICSLGNNKGIGIDPAIVKSKINQSINIEFLKSYYSRDHKRIKSDLICCRHTLEHIKRPDDFVKLIKNNTKKQESQLLLFEVPDTTRILNEIAFWDIYYEHCSYFTKNSISYLFENNGFRIEDIWLDYNDQYILLEALTQKEKSNNFSKKRVRDTIKSTRIFKQKLNIVKVEWKRKLSVFENENKKVVLWGGGSKPVGFLTMFSRFNLFQAIVDINPNMNGKFVPGYGIEIILPERLKDINPDVIIIMNSIYCEEIKSMVKRMKLDPEFLLL